MSKGFDNPLMPSAKLRQIYLAMVQTRMLAKRLRMSKTIAGMEAALVSTSIDLSSGDLVSDALGGGAVDSLRGASVAELLGLPARRGVKPAAVCGAASKLPAAATATERLWFALGAAASLKSTAAVLKAGGVETKGSGVVVALFNAGEAPKAVWTAALTFAAAQELPIVFVVLPPARGVSAGNVSAIALKSGVPGIAVDGDDAVAIYRVAQESIGRARAGGGAALMECVPFVLAGAKPRRADAIASLEQYMLQRRVATQGWMKRAEKAFAERIEVKG